MLREFREFIARGNVLDLAVAVIIGAAFGKIVTSLTEDLVMPVIGAIFGKVDFTSLFVILGDVPADYKGSLADYTALKAAGVPLFGYGHFVTEVINFVIIAFAIFLIVKAANRINRPAEAPAGPTEIELLTEIRDALKK
ncbi:large conductance mechanosensitive channel protein MscL [Sphingomonas sp. LaA6.9]|uniref:large conductance mechanosensitive channel protein MscL n=1 Tax=Sphingomonas sp. LaA6.9 TaxID=2919914 RepID=UPI001F4FE044|nr:large conductance mechanosensitive channel protein MscL [Sphingomonas sp. LaA6.9]MCJ8157976.1 large conductance mechanosensitive channel protein MscL [Sphingomonas sp. LaA6.9]